MKNNFWKYCNLSTFTYHNNIQPEVVIMTKCKELCSGNQRFWSYIYIPALQWSQFLYCYANITTFRVQKWLWSLLFLFWQVFNASINHYVILWQSIIRQYSKRIQNYTTSYNCIISIQSMFRKIQRKKGHFISIQQKSVVLNRADWVCMQWYRKGPGRAHGVGGPKHTTH